MKNLRRIWTVIILMAVGAAAVTDDRRGVTVVPVTATAPSGNAGLFVGVNQFTEDKSLRPLQFAVNDAIAQAYLFVLDLKLLPPANTLLALSGEPSTATATAQLTALRSAGVQCGAATKPALLRTLYSVSGAAAGGDDLLIVSLSSHGFEERGIAYVLPADGLHTDLQETGVNLAAIEQRLSQSKAGKRLLLVDACRENPTASSRGTGDLPMSTAFRSALAAAEGQAVLASCDAGQLSLENPDLGHGVFTFFLLDALKGKAAADARGFITLGAVKEYVAQAVQDWVVKNRPGVKREKAQHPWFKGPTVAEQIPLAVDSGIKTRQATFKRDVAQAIESLKTKINRKGEFNAAMYERLAESLEQAKDDEAGRKLLAKAKDFTDGKLDEETFVAYIEKHVLRKAPPASFKEQFTQALRELQARVEPAGPIPRDIYDDLAKGVAQMSDTEVPDAQGQAMFVALQQATQSDAAARAFIAKMKAAQKQARQTIVLNNLKQIGIAVAMYASDNNDSYPTNLNALVGNYLPNNKLFFHPVSGVEVVYLCPKQPLKSPDRTIIAYMLGGADGCEVLFGDGHVSHMDQVDLEIALRTQQPAATAPTKPETAAVKLPQATKDQPWVNSLSMKFVPVKGTDVLFSIWETRAKDYAVYATANRGMDTSWKDPKEQGVPVTPDQNCPVVYVGWGDATGFCDWLTRKEKSEGRLTEGQKYRLPTDAEWSVAVGLGPETGNTPAEKSGKIRDVYPWGGTRCPPTEVSGNYADETAKEKFDRQVIDGYRDGYATSAPVGSFDANQFGLFDMSGNASEWCEDLFEPSKSWRLLRGGSWSDHTSMTLSSSRRLNWPPDHRTTFSGFRCVLDVGLSSSR